MRKRIQALTLSVALLATTVLAGCGSTQTAETTKAEVKTETKADAKTETNTETSEEVKENVSIRFGTWTATDDRRKEGWNKVIESYEAINPHVDVELVVVDPSNSQTWLTMQLTGGTAPDVSETKLGWATMDYNKGFIYDLTDMMDEKNPYQEADTFLEGYSESTQAQLKNENGKYLAASSFTAVTKVFYNKDMFEQAGITEEPQNWDEFIAVHEALSAAGLPTFSFPNSKPKDNMYNWIERLLTYQVVEEMIPELDINENGYVDGNELIRGVDLGVVDITKSPFKDVFVLMKDWSQYFAEGYNAIDVDTAKQMFIRQDAAMMLAELSLANDLVEMGSEFEYGMFTFPMITKDNIPEACEEAYEMGGAIGSGFCIPTSTEGAEYDAAKDFIFYLHSEEATSIVAEYLRLAPTTVEVTDESEALIPTGNLVVMNLYGPEIDNQFFEDSCTFGQLFLLGEMSLEEYTSELQLSLLDAAERLKQVNGWTAENNYTTAE